MAKAKTLGIIGKKLGMSQVFREDGTAEAVTAIEAEPCTVVQVKTVAKEGYNAAQLGSGKVKRAKGARRDSAKKQNEYKYRQEFRLDETQDIEAGQTVDVSLFQAGDLIDVTGVSKGKGFAGVVKRHNFSGGPKTHGQSDRHRAPGSIGAGSTPGRVWKGLRMAGHMGNKRVTVSNLKVSAVDPARHLLLVRGAVPGGKNGLLMIRKSARRK